MSIGVIVTLVILGGGVLFLLIRALAGKDIDRRLIFLLVGLAVGLPLVFPIEFDEIATPLVKRLFDTIEELPPGSTILLSYDFDPGMAPELQPMANAVTRHALSKGHKIVYMSLWATGQAQLNQTIQQVLPAEFPDKLEREEWANVGFKAGQEGVLRVILSDFRKMFPTDIHGTPIDSVPVLRGISAASDFDLIVSFGGGKPGPREWVLFVADPGQVPFASGVAAVSAPELYPYYPRQMLALVGGIKGAAEYESELIRAYPQFAVQDTPGKRMMGPQTLAHVIIMSLIVIGNIVYFRSQRRERQRS